jgi:L-aspartate oxidase
VHGANRLASNSLLEGLVFGARAGQAMREELRTFRNHGGALAAHNGHSRTAADPEAVIHEMQQLMWNKVGIVRTRQSLNEALECLQAIAQRLPTAGLRRDCEAINLHTASLLVTRSALARLESRGAHYRLDYPDHDDAKYRKHSVVTQHSLKFV